MLKWAKSTEDYYFAAINSTSFYRITENCLSHTWELAELTENKPYHTTIQLGTDTNLDNAKKRAENREINKLKRRKSCTY
jgi:hypothetical protein